MYCKYIVNLYTYGNSFSFQQVFNFIVICTHFLVCRPVFVHADEIYFICIWITIFILTELKRKQPGWLMMNKTIKRSIAGRLATRRHGEWRDALCFRDFHIKHNNLINREAIKEDDDGLLDGAIAELIQKAKRKRQAEKTKQNRLGMMRHMFIVLDCSESMSVPDLKPTRLLCTLKLLEIFIEEFFDQNPISQLGIIALKAKRAEKITELTGTSRVHLKALEG